MPKKRHMVHTFEEVRDRSDEFNQELLEARAKEEASRASGGAHVEAPSRWETIMVSDVLRYYQMSISPEKSQLLSDKSWGILDEVAKRFGEDGHTLTENDMERISELCGRRNTHKLSIKALYEDMLLRNDAVDRIRLQNMRVQGNKTHH